MQANKVEVDFTAREPIWKNGPTYTQIVRVSIATLIYLLLAAWLLGLKAEHIGLAVLYNALYYISSGTRKFILGFSVFLSYSALYDFMKAFPNYWFSHVNISGIYMLEKSLFGINDNGSILIPSEYFLYHGTAFLNVLTGLFYLCWIPVPLIFSAYLFFKNRTQFMYFSVAFMVVNIIGFTIWYLVPAAPPWYVQQHGFDFTTQVASNEAGLARFDQFFNITLFHSIYLKGSNVFAAFPSLHSAYPMVVFYYGIKNRLGIINILFATIMVGIWFAAVYTSHHYVLDVLAGIVCGITGLFLFEKVLIKTKLFQSFFKMYGKAIM